MLWMISAQIAKGTTCKFKKSRFYFFGQLLALTNYSLSMVLEILYSHDLIQNEEAAKLSILAKNQESLVNIPHLTSVVAVSLLSAPPSRDVKSLLIQKISSPSCTWRRITLGLRTIITTWGLESSFFVVHSAPSSLTQP